MDHGIFGIHPRNGWDFTKVLWVKVGFKAKKPWLTWMGINGGVMIFIRIFLDEKVRRIAHDSHYDLGLLPIFMGTWSLSILNMNRKYSVNSNSENFGLNIGPGQFFFDRSLRSIPMGFLSLGVSTSHHVHFNTKMVMHDDWMMWGYPNFRKPAYIWDYLGIRFVPSSFFAKASQTGLPIFVHLRCLDVWPLKNYCN